MALPSGGSPSFTADGNSASTSAGSTNQLANIGEVSWVKVECDSASSFPMDVEIVFKGDITQQFSLAAGESEEFAARSSGGNITAVYIEGDGGTATFNLRVKAIG